MLDFVTRPLRQALRAVESEFAAEVRETHQIEAHILDAVDAIRHATASIEQHVEVIETLATSVAPLGDSVNRLTDTMDQLVALMAPMESAERGVHRLEHLFGRHRDKPPPEDSGPS